MKRIWTLPACILSIGAIAACVYIACYISPRRAPASPAETKNGIARHDIYDIASLTLRPLSYEQSFRYFDSASVHIGILSGEYDTTITEPHTYVIHTGILSLPPINHKSPVLYVKSVRDYLYRLIPVAHDTGDIPHTLEADDKDTIIRRLSRLEYQGTCQEHAMISKRVLQDSMTTIAYTLKKDNKELVDHVIDLIYYRQNGRVYAVTFDALMGIIGPVRADGSHYMVNELDHIDPVLDYPIDRKTKRYTIDTARVFSNMNSKVATAYYACNGYIYYQGYDDMYILAPKEILYDKMPRDEFDKEYALMLAEVLRKHIPAEVKTVR